MAGISSVFVVYFSDAEQLPSVYTVCVFIIVCIHYGQLVLAEELNRISMKKKAYLIVIVCHGFT